jgi:peptidoglycan hydrolase-like protein with peptidoglycan-binding domain
MCPPTSHRSTRTLTTLLGILAATSLVAGCGSDTDSAAPSSAPTTDTVLEYEEVNAVGHGDGDGDKEGHDLAVGDQTPKDPQGRLYLHHGDSGPDVTTMQERLVELGAPIGKPDGIYGDQTLHAVLAFQRSEGLTADGVVGTATWAALDAPTRSIEWDLPEVPTEHDTTPIATPSSTATTAPVTTAPAARGDGANVGPQQAPPQDPGVGKWAKAVVTLSNQTATFYDGAGNIVLQAPISSGKNGLTPAGTFHVQSKSQRAYAGGSSGVYMDWMTRFNGGIGFHSIPKQAGGRDLPTPLGQAPVSHGCIRMPDEAAKQVYDNLPVGALVEVHA